MAEEKIYVNDAGTEIIIDMQENMAAATNISFLVKKPDGSEATWTGIEKVETTKLKYITQAGDLNLAGPYKIQVKLTLSNWTGKSKTVNFMVYDKFT